MRFGTFLWAAYGRCYQFAKAFEKEAMAALGPFSQSAAGGRPGNIGEYAAVYADEHHSRV
jgi:hypothetical protein